MLDQVVTFGRYRLDPRGGLVFGNREVRLTPKALALLCFLANRPGRLFTKDELFAELWPDTTVGDAALVTCIQEVRKALHDTLDTSKHCTGEATGSSENPCHCRFSAPRRKIHRVNRSLLQPSLSVAVWSYGNFTTVLPGPKRESGKSCS